jgi:hypothetical protein
MWWRARPGHTVQAPLPQVTGKPILGLEDGADPPISPAPSLLNPGDMSFDLCACKTEKAPPRGERPGPRDYTRSWGTCFQIL